LRRLWLRDFPSVRGLQNMAIHHLEQVGTLVLITMYSETQSRRKDELGWRDLCWVELDYQYLSILLYVKRFSFFRFMSSYPIQHRGQTMADQQTDLDRMRDRHQRLYETAEPLFVRYGFRKTTVEDICKEAGISKRTFYDTFKDKSDFFARMVFAISEQVILAWFERIPIELDPRGKVESFLDLYCGRLVRRPIFRVMAESLDSLAAFGSLGSEISASPIMRAMCEIIDEGKKVGQFREMNTEIVVWMIFSLLDSMYLLMPELFKIPHAIPNEILDREIREFIVKGLISPNYSPTSYCGG
jgi:AcrR family transcriptional regulator